MMHETKPDVRFVYFGFSFTEADLRSVMDFRILEKGHLEEVSSTWTIVDLCGTGRNSWAFYPVAPPLFCSIYLSSSEQVAAVNLGVCLRVIGRTVLPRAIASHHREPSRVFCFLHAGLVSRTL